MAAHLGRKETKPAADGDCLSFGDQSCGVAVRRQRLQKPRKDLGRAEFIRNDLQLRADAIAAAAAITGKSWRRIRRKCSMRGACAGPGSGGSDATPFA